MNSLRQILSGMVLGLSLLLEVHGQPTQFDPFASDVDPTAEDTKLDPFGSYRDPTAEDIQVAVDKYRAAVDRLGSEEEWGIGWDQHVLLKKSLNARKRKTLKPIFDDETAYYLQP